MHLGSVQLQIGQSISGSRNRALNQHLKHITLINIMLTEQQQKLSHTQRKKVPLFFSNNSYYDDT